MKFYFHTLVVSFILLYPNKNRQCKIISDGTVDSMDPNRNLQEFWDFGSMLINREIAFEAYDYISVTNTLNGNVVAYRYYYS